MTTVVNTADVVTTKTGPATANAGANITYTLTVRNAGPGAATGIVLVDTLPATATFVSASAGGTLGAGNAYPSVADTASLWLGANGCEPDMLDAAGPLDLDRVLPGPETVVQASTGCDQGGHVEVWTIVGGGHIPDLSPSFPEEVIGLLLAHPRP